MPRTVGAMGRLTYDGFDTPIVVDDLELAHLKLVMTTKLRRAECFSLSWRHPDGSGRSTLWIHPNMQVRFDFDSAGEHELDPARIARMADEAAFGAITFGCASA